MNATEILAIKAAVRQRDDFRCVDCGMTADEHRARYGKTLDVHRLIPGGDYSCEGCETLCRACHSAKPKRPRGSCVDGRHLAVNLGSGLRARAERQAARLGMSPSAYIRLALVQGVERDEVSGPNCLASSA